MIGICEKKGYSRKVGVHFIYVVLYVINANTKGIIKEVKYQQYSKFDTKDICVRAK